jgi:hypothetical protein
MKATLPRRAVITALAGAVIWQRVAQAQDARVWRIGFLTPRMQPLAPADRVIE